MSDAAVPEDTLERARKGANWHCIECHNPALGGGLWCYRHFLVYAPLRRPPRARPTCGTPSGYSTHKRHRERACARCHDARLRARREG